MSKLDLGDVCERFLSSRLLKQTESSFCKKSLSNEYIANEHKYHTILSQKLLFKPYKKNPLDQLRKRYSNIIIPITNDINTTSCNNNQSITHNNNNNNNKSSLMMNWQLLKDRGSGLINLGNTCFINASLQCLANTPPLVQWLLSNSHHQHCRIKLEKQFCLFCEAERIVKLIHTKNSFTSSISPANPNNIVRRIKDISKTFRCGRQEDASEFLICLIDKIIEACLRSSQPPERLRPSSGTSYEQLCHSQTFLHDLFGLVLRSRVICSRCHYTSDTFEVQYTWIVSVRNHSDLRQSLQQFVCHEKLSGENLYRCIKCKQLVPAIKHYTLHKASKILLINLKRFEFGKNSHKLSHLVRYPEYLNVKSYMSEENSNNQSLNYRLYAVLVHVGSSMHSGHYYSYVRSPNNRWYKADDTTMTQCDLNHVLTQHGAYILCYINETEPSLTNNLINGTTTTATITKNKNIYQNGKLNHSKQQSNTLTTNSKFFTSRQIPIQNHPRQINGLIGHTKSKIESSNTNSTNSNGIVSTEKRQPIVMNIPKSSYQLNQLIHENNHQSTSSELLNKSNSTSTSLSPINNSNYSVSSLTNSPSSSSSSSKLTIKSISSSSKFNEFSSISNSNNPNNNENHDSSEFVQSVKKKQRIEDSSSSLILSSSSQTNSIDEQSVSSSLSLSNNLKKKKKKHKFDKHHHHHNHHVKRLHNHSYSPMSKPQSFTTDDQYQQHHKNKKHHFHRQSSLPLSREPS
ncbi:unnamed protein product [Rotaria sordida]|uniref:Ubiquitin carboxyl-terminal hydrolase n=1 Tax=Rotaria sordida TaxID=392033 RepID=A0A814TEW8_9BILA|nr:unnamed protein product [Rotaria sordida]CAF1161227.1 unnamed protein product [Rotaria sordida]CAF3593287.1 unnamed protein product [Rotaria sordida]CAF3760455.1 unnamed protein product [Rotaria sordida]